MTREIWRIHSFAHSPLFLFIERWKEREYLNIRVRRGSIQLDNKRPFDQPFPRRYFFYWTRNKFVEIFFLRKEGKPEIFEFLIILKRGDFLCDSVSLDFSNLPRFHAQNLRNPVVTITGGGGGHRRGERLDNSGQETKERGEQGLVLNFKRSGETSGRPTGLQSEIKR